MIKFWRKLTKECKIGIGFPKKNLNGILNFGITVARIRRRSEAMATKLGPSFHTEPPTSYTFANDTGNLQLYTIYIRNRQRFFEQVGHETMFVSSGNKHFFTKSYRRQTYQNYEQPPQTYQNSDFQSHFSVSKISQIFPKKYFLKNIRLVPCPSM